MKKYLGNLSILFSGVITILWISGEFMVKPDLATEPINLLIGFIVGCIGFRSIGIAVCNTWTGLKEDYKARVKRIPRKEALNK